MRLRFECQGDTPLGELELGQLRLYLSGDNQLIANLYELIFNNVIRAELRRLDGEGEPIVLEPEEALRQVGFEPEEGLLPYPKQSFLGYRLLTEFFAFPAKFRFVDLAGLQNLRGRKWGQQFEVVLYLNRTITALEQELGPQNFRLGCTPIVNLFRQTAEPVPLTQTHYEYRVLPDVHRQQQTEVYSIDEVLSADRQRTRQYRPFYSFRHQNAWSARQQDDAYWYASRRPAMQEGDRGTDVFLHLVDLDFEPRLPAESVLVVRTTCTNRDWPIKLQQAGDKLQFQLESAVPVKSIQCLHSPTRRYGHLRRGHNGDWFRTCC